MNMIIFEPNPKDQYFRKSVELATSDVIITDDKKMSGVVERLSATTLKAIQDQLFSMSRQKKIEELAADKSHEIFRRYEIRFKEKYIARKSKELLVAGKSVANAEVLQRMAEAELARKSTQLKRYAQKEAWVQTIRSEIADDELKFEFYAPSLTSHARVNDSNKDKLHKNVKKMQEKFQNWSEKIFDERSGELATREVNGVLFPVSEYIRTGRGGDNRIVIKVEKELAHCVIFLNQNYLKFHFESYVKLEMPNATRLYELLIDIFMNPGNIKKSNEQYIDDLQKKFSTKYDKRYEFIRNVIAPAIKQINDKLGCSISWVPVKKFRKEAVSIEFVMSAEDKALLNGYAKARVLDPHGKITEELTASFGYYLALMRLLKEGEKIEDFAETAHSINAELAAKRYDFGYEDESSLYEEYVENLDAIDLLKEILSEHPNIEQQYEFDAKMLVLLEIGSGLRMADTATECLEILKVDVLPHILVKQPQLPGFEEDGDGEVDDIEQFLPFELRLTSKRTVLLNTNNYALHKRGVELAIEKSEFEKFIFEDDDTRERFISVFAVGGGKGSVVEAEIIESSVNSALPVLNKVLSLFGAASPELIGDIHKWDGVIQSLLSQYNEEEIIAVVNFLTNSKEGRFHFQHITSAEKFEQTFSSKLHAYRAVGTPIVNGQAGGDYNVFDVIGKTDEQ